MSKNPPAKKAAPGNGGELHQQADNKATGILTTQQGVPIADDQNSLRAGVRGPTLMEDQLLREKIFHFDHERIPERVVHARGFGAHGYFQNYTSLADITHADLFRREGEKTPAFVRFSTVAGNKGSFDLARDVRGFAVKLHTKEGNWDIVGNNIPVFFIQDAIKFPLFKALKDAVEASGAMVEIIAPRIGGVIDNTGNVIRAQQKLGGGPSVLYDAVALLLSADSVAAITSESAARDFVNDAFAHCKFIAYSSAAVPLLESAGIASLLDGGCFDLGKAKAIEKFLKACKDLRSGKREEAVNKG